MISVRNASTKVTDFWRRQGKMRFHSEILRVSATRTFTWDEIDVIGVARIESTESLLIIAEDTQSHYVLLHRTLPTK